MNILSSEDMLEAEAELLAVSPTQNFVLRVPDQREYQNINHLEGALFPQASPAAQKTVHKMVSLTDSMRALKISTPNSGLQMFIFNIMSILYQDKCRSGNQNEGENSHFLLQTLKCTLFSPNLDFSCIKNADFQINTLQMKALTSRFFVFMENQSLRLTVNRLKCAQWILQKNPILLHTFILLFRFILFRLEFEGANNYRTALDMEESMVNLIEYLDLSYRSFGELILFYEDGVFMAFADNEVVVGDYFQNQIEKKSEKQQFQIKSSVKLNMIESFLLNVDSKSSLISPKKNTIGDSDLKLMNFMLDNSVEESMDESQTDEGVVLREKQIDLSTPTFNNQPAQFHFGKSKSKRTQDDIKSQFARLILDKSDYSEDIELENSEEMSTPFLGGEHDYSLAARFEPQLMKTLDSPIDELNNVQNIAIESSFKLETVKEKQLTIQPNHCCTESVMTPKSPGGTTLGFSLGANQQNFLLPIVSKVNDLSTIMNCTCRPLRLNRNSIESNVVIVGYIPEKPKKKVSYYTDYNPKFHNFNRTREPLKQPKDHKPAFLKTLKKHKDSHQENDFTKSTVTETMKRKSSFNRIVANDQYKFKKSSAILPEHQYRMEKMKNISQDFDTKSSKSLNFVTNHTSMNRFQGRIRTQGLIHSPSNSQWFNQPPPEYSTLQKMNNNYLSSQGSPSSKAPPSKVYAPRQIIAPTAYFGSASHNTNNAGNFVCKINQFESNTSNPESKIPERAVPKIINEVDPSKYYSLRNQNQREQIF